MFPQTDSAIHFISKNKEKPFLLVLSWGPPHDPYATAPEEFRKLYKPEVLTLRPNIPDFLKADGYMQKWKYRYDGNDSLRVQ